MDHIRRRTPSFPTPVATPTENAATQESTSRDPSPDTAATSRPMPRQDGDDTDDASRQSHFDKESYSLTVEDVAVRLADENLYRDPRTIQRWCKAHRLDCILDSDNGERYLIEPTSVEKMVATLVRDRDRRSRQGDDVPRQESRPVERHRDNAATHDATRPETSPTEKTNQDAEAASNQTEPAANDSNLKARIRDLESKLTLAEADKQVRDRMVDYMKEQFEGMIDNAMERAEEVGQLRAENTQLKSLLDAPPSTGGDNVNAPEGVEYRQ